ncbi:diaminopimelate epimerase [Verrucomicrobium sp. GAS474]|uniref:diaminopimelate epimerase n=1 Tax=Verrucomicrobium sp. GAS474 TaxID=1882831 RepID=UPI000B81DDC3|nr:diaminopimelate epimerase [Verrucomicrobium sp. GAS474]
MKLSFTKMTGAGNDFVMLDNRACTTFLSASQIAFLCDRHFGVGGDGLLLLEPPANPEAADFRMRYYNADGSEADMCGNGARCFAQFARHLGATKSLGDSIKFETLAGIISATYVGNEVAIVLTAPHSLERAKAVPTRSAGEITVGFINTGVPHAVQFVADVEKIDIRTLGAEVRYNEVFKPKGTNANFAQITGPDSIRVRTYERGVEDETLACGTGVSAAAVLAHLVHGVAKPVRVLVQGKSILTVDFREEGSEISNIVLQGPALVVFTGEIECP